MTLFPFMSDPAGELARIIRPFVDAHLPKLGDDFQGVFRDDLLFQHTGITIEPGTWTERTLALKQALHLMWCMGDQADRIALAGYFVRVWGGIRSLGDQALEAHTTQVSRSPLTCDFQGISSWSKIACISNPAKFAIFDARVACSLQALQLLAPPEGEKFVFPAMASRNLIVSSFVPRARAAGLRAGWPLLDKATIYAVFLQALDEATGHIAHPLRIARAEMLLFAHAERLARSAHRLL